KNTEIIYPLTFFRLTFLFALRPSFFPLLSSEFPFFLAGNFAFLKSVLIIYLTVYLPLKGADPSIFKNIENCGPNSRLHIVQISFNRYFGGDGISALVFKDKFEKTHKAFPQN